MSCKPLWRPVPVPGAGAGLLWFQTGLKSGMEGEEIFVVPCHGSIRTVLYFVNLAVISQSF